MDLLLKLTALTAYLPVVTALGLLAFGWTKLRGPSSHRARLHVAALALLLSATLIAWLLPVLLDAESGSTFYTPFTTTRQVIAWSVPRAIRDVAISAVLLLLTRAVFAEPRDRADASR